MIDTVGSTKEHAKDVWIHICRASNAISHAIVALRRLRFHGDIEALDRLEEALSLVAETEDDLARVFEFSPVLDRTGVTKVA